LFLNAWGLFLVLQYLFLVSDIFEMSSVQILGSKTQTWYSRTFVLQGNFLFYYEEKLNDTNFKGVVLLKVS
jgi:hypothetical protein